MMFNSLNWYILDLLPGLQDAGSSPPGSGRFFRIQNRNLKAENATATGVGGRFKIN